MPARREPGRSPPIVMLWDALRGDGAGRGVHKGWPLLRALLAWLSNIVAKALSALKDVWLRAKPGEAPPVPHDAPAHLLKAVNDAASTGNTSWIFFLAQMAYFYITVASVTHKDLLLNAPVQLPLLQTQISLEFFFQWGPFVFVLLHFGLLLQHEMLACKLKGLNDALAPTEGNAPGSNPLRLELSSYFFAQSMAGPPRSTILKVLMGTMIFLTFGLLPVGLLLFFQITFLPYHSEEVSWWQRGAVISDLAIITMLGVFLTFPGRPYFEAFLCNLRRRPAAFARSVLIGTLALVVSFFVAVVPDGRLEKDLFAGPLCWKVKVESPSENGPKRWACFLTALLFEGPVEGRTLTRSLVVMDQDLVPDEEWEPKKPSLLLAKRNLSYARFDRSDLHRADLREANLSGASLNGANLREARIACVDFGKEACTILTGASLQGTTLENADLGRARLRGADLSGASLRGADLSDAHLQQANLGSDLVGANLSSARLQGANLWGADLEGANLSGARLQGATLTEASLQGADLSGARLQGANLSKAKLQGANLWRAHLEGVDLNSAKIWQARPPKSDPKWADMRDVNLAPPSSEDLQALQRMADGIDDKNLRERIKESFEPLLNEVKAKEWENSDVQKAWHEMVRISLIDDDEKRAGLSDYLGTLACTDDSDAGWVARGILSRATSQEVELYDALPDVKEDADAQMLQLVKQGRGQTYSVELKQLEGMHYTFNGDPARLYARLTEPDCRVAAKLKEHVLLKDLKKQAEKGKANQEP
jgi:uncharacterized protein YjbI with pentapeptide repeats